MKAKPEADSTPIQANQNLTVLLPESDPAVQKAREISDLRVRLAQIEEEMASIRRCIEEMKLPTVPARASSQPRELRESRSKEDA